jgi:DNA-binding GntR family transcriptional regulator
VRLGRLWGAPLQELDGANFMSLIQTECKLPITDVKKLVRLEILDGGVAKILQVKRGTPGLLVDVIATAGRDRCVFYQQLFVPPNPRQLQFPDHRSIETA